MDPIPVEAFLEAFPPAIRSAAERLRTIVRSVAPDALEQVRPGWGIIGYNVPVGRRSPYIGGVFPQDEHCHLLFERGVLMEDPNGVLEGAGVTKQVRWLTFKSPNEVVRREQELLVLTREAIRVATMSRGERVLLSMSREA